MHKFSQSYIRKPLRRYAPHVALKHTESHPKKLSVSSDEVFLGLAVLAQRSITAAAQPINSSL